jgi:heme/copper-type cytochrome/quinol oxidase subunit 3
MARSMSERDLRLVHPPPRERKVLVPNQVLGTMIFILTEVMLFAGFISAYAIARTNVPVWPPAGQPRLPIEATGVNTLVLLASGALMFYAGKRFAESADAAKKPMLAAVALGVVFVAVQGFEWAQLLSQGLTLQTSSHSAFFYLIVGMHALHVMAGTLVVLRQARQLWAGTLHPDSFWAGRLFWYFVVLLWPVLYWQVYL